MHKSQSKKRKRNDFEGDKAEFSQEVISKMSKRIKLLEGEIRRLSETQLKMKKEIESLIKKNVKRPPNQQLKS